MEYCDFASIMSIVRGDLIEGSFSNQMGLVDVLFSAYIDKCEDGAFFDEGQVSKWFSGRLKVSPAISHFYATDDDARDLLAVTFEDEIIPNLSDDAIVTDKVYDPDQNAFDRMNESPTSTSEKERLGIFLRIWESK